MIEKPSPPKVERTSSRRQLLGMVVILFSAWYSAGAQTTSPTDGMTPAGMSPGSPAGAYGLSGFDNINLYNGNLNVALPLLGVGGRGGAQTQMTLTLDSVHWQVEHDTIDGMEYYYVNPNWWEGIRPGYGPGVLQARNAVVPLVMNPNSKQTLTRLTFTAPDGTEYELVDTYRGGEQYGGLCNPSTRPRGTVFVSHEGTAFVTFVSNTTLYDQCTDTTAYSDGISGYLYFSDGSRYEIANGVVTKIRDRNGNLISFAYDAYKRVTTITDSLNRQVTVSYANMVSVFYDQITFKGFGGAQRTIKIWRSSLAQALRAGYSVQTYGQLFAYVNPFDSNVYNPSSVVSAVELPDGRQFQLRYNSYGEMARVVLPTGGAIEYDYVEMAAGAMLSQRRVSERRVYADGVTVESKQIYTATYNTTTTTVVEQKDASNRLLGKSKHYFYNDPISSINNSYISSLVYSQWQDGKEFKSESLAADGTTVLRRTEQTWEQGATVTNWLALNNAANNPRVNQTVTTLVDTNQVAKQTYTFDQYNNTTNVYDYDFGAGGAGALLRRTHTDFMTVNPVNGIDYTSTANNRYFRRLPSQSQVFDAAGVEKARTTYEYDNYASDGSHAPLVNRTLISGHDSSFTTSYTIRANVTKVTRWRLPSTQLSTYSQFDIAGNVTEAIDARGYATNFFYTDCFGTPNGEAHTNIAPTELASQSQTSYAMLTKVTNALNQTAHAQYDYYLGKPVDGEDMNGVVATGYYNDDLDRATQVVRDFGNLAAKSQTTFTYDDVNRIVTTRSDFAAYNDNLLRKDAFYDGLGRTTETRAYENATQYITAKEVPFVVLQDPDTSAWVTATQSSNPYRSYLGQQPVWTTTFLDALGRTSKVRTPDNAIARTAYSGNAVTATDQAGKVRRSISDALGRLTRVDEPDTNGNLGTVSTPTQPTSYTYSVLDDLLTVSQGVQTRTFVYDSLKRLTSATNPESGTVSNTYDNNGNLLTRTDARNITTTFTYDALNRPTLKNYSDATPDVAYFYDAQTLPGGAPSFNRGSATGRLVAQTYGGASAGDYFGYDALGRTLRKIQQTDGVNYLIEAAYNATSAMTSETYPSVPGASDRRIITYSFDTAGRLSSLNSIATSYAPAASVTNVSYAPHGGLASETYGGLIHAATYNNRLQTSQIKLGTSSNPTSVLSLTYNYGTTSNNGNIQSMTYAGGGLSYTQSFTYDSLNRLATSQEGASWSQTNSYDRYGNRWVVGSGLTFNTSNNRMVGYSYDASGNLLNDGYAAYTYDAEGHIKTVNAATAYTYDGDGQRVKKLVGENVRFVYGVGGELVAEFDGANGSLKKEYVYGGGTVATIEPTAVNSNGTRYSTADHLGSPRVITNSTAGIVSRHDYKPFGEELGSGIGGRTVGMGFGVADGNRKKFTGYERDTETGLDFAQARYYSNTQGRFTSPDPFSGSMHPTDPKSFNRYAYVGNNPMNLIDPTGMAAQGGGGRLPGANGALGRAGVGQGLDPSSGTDDYFIYSSSSSQIFASFNAAILSAFAEAAEILARASQDPVPQPHPTPTPVPKPKLEPGKVYLCRRPTQINGVFSVVNSVAYHYWIKTDEKEAGLGALGGGVPGQNEGPDSPYVSQTSINDHTGQSEKSDSSCEVDSDADPRRVNQQLVVGKQMGRFSGYNNCLTFAQGVLFNSYSREVQLKKLAH